MFERSLLNMATPFDGRSAHNQSPKSLSDIADSASSVTRMQAAAPKPKTIRRAHPGQGVPVWRASKWPNHRSCVENGEKGLGRDHLYSVAAITNAAGAVVERYRYDTFGNRIILAVDGITTRAVSSYNQQVGFTGRYEDKETKLWYFRARYYSGSLGRFVSRDPIGYVDGYSLYQAYQVPNNLDPSGWEVRTFDYNFTLVIADQTKWHANEWLDSGVERAISWKRYQWNGKCCEEWDESAALKLELEREKYEKGSLKIPVNVKMTLEGIGDAWGQASLALAAGGLVAAASGAEHAAILAEIAAIGAKLISGHDVKLLGQTHTMGSSVFESDGSGIKYGAVLNFRVTGDNTGDIGTTSVLYGTHKISEQECTSKNSTGWVDHVTKRNKARGELEAEGQKFMKGAGQ